MCKVYRAMHKKSNTLRAIRVMKLTEKNTIDKIKIEIALMQLTEHLNIVKYYESILYMDTLFMVIEYMNGGYNFCF